jgi:hypothetical protein
MLVIHDVCPQLSSNVGHLFNGNLLYWLRVEARALWNCAPQRYCDGNVLYRQLFGSGAVSSYWLPLLRHSTRGRTPKFRILGLQLLLPGLRGCWRDLASEPLRRNRLSGRKFKQSPDSIVCFPRRLRPRRSPSLPPNGTPGPLFVASPWRMSSNRV